ncbi:pX [Duck adenovirus 2]|uniref:PX n=1 Tax=Duck adenovirus 2 TaxID=1520006 RepID=A0A075FAB1_9ADEN|nr:pX [Duck adenovirus 2]AIE77220.1 pX [Duck adenovirus 2]UIY90550.1 pX [Duck adenovirus 2]
MPSVVLTGGRAKRRRSSIIKLPRLPKRKRTKYVTVKNPSGSAEAERAALQTLAQRFQRGSYGGLKSTVNEAARTAAAYGTPVSATNVITGHSAHAVPLTGSGLKKIRRSSRKARVSKRKRLRGGIFPALIPLIAAAIGAIPGIAGTAVGIANLKEQQRQYNEQMKLQREQLERLTGKKK